MKKIGFICAAMLLFGTVSAKAQGLLDKIDRTINKVERAGNTADRAGKTGSKLSSLFGKKNSETEPSAETTTTINISGVDFTTLKSINEKAENTKGVASSKIKFSTAVSTISLLHNGSTEDLLSALQKTNPTIFSEENIEGLEEGQISIKVNK